MRNCPWMSFAWFFYNTVNLYFVIIYILHGFQDLLSVMIKGPVNTPYEDGLFFFDVQLPANFPNSPPVFHYISFCNERLNPNLYEDGKVCVSLLGTWTGKVWIPLLYLYYALKGWVFIFALVRLSENFVSKVEKREHLCPVDIFLV